MHHDIQATEIATTEGSHRQRLRLCNSLVFAFPEIGGANDTDIASGGVESVAIQSGPDA